METEHRRLALVTGASSGIGLELAREFARRGLDVTICSDDAPQLSQAERALRAEFPQAAIEAVEADLSTRDGVETIWSAVEPHGPRLAVVAANAGAGVAGPFAETDLDDELSMIGLNVLGQVALAKHAVRHFLRHGGGSLLITSSLVAMSPGPFMAIYAATKSFLRSFGLAIREELKDHPVDVTVLMLGATDTDFFERAHMEETSIAKGSKDDPAAVAREAVDALEKGQSWVVSGMANKARAAAAAVTPDTVLAKANRGQASR